MKKIMGLLVIFITLIIFVYVGRIKLAAFYNNQGIRYYDRGLYAKAIFFLKKSLQIHPSMAITHYNLANAYLEGKLENEAIEEYKKTIQLDPAYISAYRSLTNIYLSRQMYKEALNFIKQAEIYASSDPGIKRLINNVYFEYMVDCLSKGVDSFLAGDKQRAYTLLNTALKIKSDFAYTYYTLGYFYYVDRNYDEAEINLNEAIRIDPGFYLAYKLLGDICIKRGNDEEAIDKYKTAISLNHKDAVLCNDLGLILMQMERYNEAIVYLKQALTLDPHNADIRYSLASVCRDNGMFNEAFSEYKEIVYYQPDYPNVHNDLGDIYKRQGKNKEALDEYHSEIRYSQYKLSRNQNDVVILNNLANAYNNIEDHSKAEKIIKNVIALKPEYQAAYLTLAKIQEDLNNHKEALASLNKAKSLSGSRQLNSIDRDMSRLKKILSQLGCNLLYFDTIYLKNGRLIKGLIKKETKEDIILDVYIGNSTGVITLPRDNIERIVKSSDIKND